MKKSQKDISKDIKSGITHILTYPFNAECAVKSCKRKATVYITIVDKDEPENYYQETHTISLCQNHGEKLN